MHAGPIRPEYVLVSVAAAALGVSAKAVRRWCQSGRLRAIKLIPKLHYTDTRPRKRRLGYWRIELESVYELLRDAYAGAEVPRAIRLKLRRLARPLGEGTVSEPTTQGRGQ